MNPQVFMDYRPISLCNVIYRFVAKALALRLKKILLAVILDKHSALQPNHLISDNSMLAFEVSHILKRKTIGKLYWVALKLDMSKAFGKIELVFLKQLMHNLEFATPCINKIMMCITHISYYIMQNGSKWVLLIRAKAFTKAIPLPLYY